MHLHIVNGPNLNLLGKREVDIYGKESFEDFLKQLQQKFPNVKLTYFQSNVEGEIITESMAEVFARQGKTAKAAELYQKLSLLNPLKSAYFAAKIEQLKGV